VVKHDVPLKIDQTGRREPTADALLEQLGRFYQDMEAEELHNAADNVAVPAEEE